MTRRLLVVDGPYPPNYSGAGLRLHRHYLRLQQRLSVELTVLSLGHPGSSFGWSAVDGIRVYRTRGTPAARDQIIQVMRFLSRTSIYQFDAIHAAGLYALPGLMSLAAIAARRLLIREATLSRQIPTGRGWRQRTAAVTFRRADLIIARTAEEQRRYLALGLSPKQIWRVNYAVDDSVFRPGTEAETRTARSELGIPLDAVVHIVVGRLCRRKNQAFAVSALAQLPDSHHLILLGPSSSPYAAGLERTIAYHRLESRVHRREAAGDDVVSYFHAANTCWIPSLSEGVPNAMKEALLCGLPIIANNVLNLDEFLAHPMMGQSVELDKDLFASAALCESPTGRVGESRSQIASRSRDLFGSSVVDARFADRLGALLD